MHKLISLILLIFTFCFIFGCSNSGNENVSKPANIMTDVDRHKFSQSPAIEWYADFVSLWNYELVEYNYFYFRVPADQENSYSEVQLESNWGSKLFISLDRVSSTVNIYDTWMDILSASVNVGDSGTWGYVRLDNTSDVPMIEGAIAVEFLYATQGGDYGIWFSDYPGWYFGFSETLIEPIEFPPTIEWYADYVALWNGQLAEYNYFYFRVPAIQENSYSEVQIQSNWEPMLFLSLNRASFTVNFYDPWMDVLSVNVGDSGAWGYVRLDNASGIPMIEGAIAIDFYSAIQGGDYGIWFSDDPGWYFGFSK